MIVMLKSVRDSFNGIMFRAMLKARTKDGSVENELEGLDGGKGSGNFGHRGRPGQVGGSGKGGGSKAKKQTIQASIVNSGETESTVAASEKLITPLKVATGEWLKFKPNSEYANPEAIRSLHEQLQKIGLQTPTYVGLTKKYLDQLGDEVGFTEKVKALYDSEDESDFKMADVAMEMRVLLSNSTGTFVDWNNPDEVRSAENILTGNALEKYLSKKAEILGVGKLDYIEEYHDVNDAVTSLRALSTSSEYLEPGQYVKHLDKSGAFQRGCDLKGLNSESCKMVVGAYADMLEKFPVLYGLMGNVSAKNYDPSVIDGNAFAYYNTKTGEICLNPKLLSSGSLWKHIYENDVNADWHPQGTNAQSVICHEIGHSLDSILSAKGCGDKMFSEDVGADVFRYKVSESVWFRVSDALGMSDKEMADGVSRYAATNISEWFAEAICEAVSSKNPRPIAAEVLKQTNLLIADWNERKGR